MDARFTPDQEMIRQTAADFLKDWKDTGGFRRLSDLSLRRDEAAWQRFSGELGFAGLTIPVASGGSGLGALERALVMEEMGRVLFMTPYFSTCVLSVDWLQAAGGEAAGANLRCIAEGGMTATVARLETLPTGGGQLNGQALGVIDGDSADIILTRAGDALFSVKASAAGLIRRPVETLDRTRALCDLDFRSVDGELIAQGAGLHEALAQAEARSAIALAAEQVGGAEAMLDATVSYALTRRQFGRVIGSFQAVKHRCADMMTAVEAARSAVYLAAALAGTDALIEHAAIAKSEASEAYFLVAAEAIQMHGGVGVTWEYDLHFHFKRARAGQCLLGTPQMWRERLAGLIGLEGAAS